MRQSLHIQMKKSFHEDISRAISKILTYFTMIVTHGQETQSLEENNMKAKSL